MAKKDVSTDKKKVNKIKEKKSNLKTKEKTQLEKTLKSKSVKKEVISEEVTPVINENIDTVVTSVVENQITDSVTVIEQITDNVVEEETILDRIIDVNLSNKRYFEEETKKTQIIIGETISGPGIRGDLESFVNNPYKKPSHIIIDRNGDIYQMFSTDYWSEHLGIPGQVFNKLGFKDAIIRNKLLNQGSITIELDNWGVLEKIAPNKYRNVYSRVFTYEDNDVSYFEKGFKGEKYYEKYTNEQLNTLSEILLYLCDEYEIPTEYKGDSMFDVNVNALGGEPGIWTTVSFKNDKFDCHPDTRLVDLLKNLKK